MTLSDVCLHFPRLIYFTQEPADISFQNYCGTTIYTFFKTYGEYLSAEDLKNILIQIFISTQVYGDLSGFLHVDAHVKNYCIEIFPPGLECKHTYRFQFNEKEFYELEFSSPYYVWLLDFGTDKPCIFYKPKTTFVGLSSEQDISNPSKSSRSNSISNSSTTTYNIQTQTSGRILYFLLNSY